MKTAPLYITEDRAKELEFVETSEGFELAITWRGDPSSRMGYQIVASERAGLAAALLLNDGSRSHVNTVTCFNFPGQTEDIARLISAAPELLAALEGVLAFEDPDSLEDQQTDARLRAERTEAWERAKAAISKATGAKS